MRLSLAITAALSGAAAAASHADVYLFRPHPPAASRDASSPQLQRQLARLILLQRLGVDGSFPAADELSSLPEDALEYVNAYGRPETPLFSEAASAEPSQLLILLEGLEPNQVDKVMQGRDRTFLIDEAPNASATRKLVESELGPAGVAESSCSFERAINPLDSECWTSGSSSIIRYDVKKDESIIEALQKATPKLAHFAETGEMETTLVLLPEAARDTPVDSWSSHPAKLLHRRQSETLLSSDETVAISAAETPAADAAAPSQTFDLGELGAVAACYGSFNACVTATGNCSDGHGICENTWAPRDEDGGRVPPKEGQAACFTCQCKKTRDSEHSGIVTHWAGARCEREDKSAAFALLLGPAVGLVLVLYAVVRGMYKLGDEPLPGVLGAGVSKKNS